MKLIDAEAAVRTIQDLCGERGDDAHVCDYCRDAIEGIRALPAAAPVVDVEKAAHAFNLPADLRYRKGETVMQHAKRRARAILTAGYAGSVSKEDVREVAGAAGHAGSCPTWSNPDAACDCKLGAAAKRLLAATEGK